jgi:ketosteroid isomerase-like protein
MRDNVELIESVWEAFSRADVDAAAGAIADEAEIVFPDTVPWGGTYRGPDGFREAVSGMLSRVGDFRAKPEMILGADDDHVVVVANITGRGQRGARLDVRVAWLYRLRAGKVIRGEAFPDTARVLEALGQAN